MKKLFILMLLLPLTALAQEHGGKAMKKKVPGLETQAAEHGGQAMKKKASDATEHGGEAMKKKMDAGTPVE